MTLTQFDRLPDVERGYWVAQWEIQQLTCRDCGHLVSECSDPKRLWYPFRRICYATMEREAAEASYAALHGEEHGFHNGTFTSWAKDRSAAYPYEAKSGVRIGVDKRDRAPHDKFTTVRNASPDESVAEQAPSEQDETAGGSSEPG
jgi:hypothetical protein